MVLEEFKKIVQITAIFFVVITSLIVLCSGDTLLSLKGLHAVTSGISITVAAWVAFIKWGWRWPFLKTLFDRPDLSGTWIGEFNTDWKNEEGLGVPKAPFVAVVRQTFLTVHVTTYTKTFVGYSYSESLILSFERGVKHLVYLYSQDPTSIGLPQNRRGATQFRIVESKKTKLEGHYWSNEKTTGYISLTRINSKPVESYQEAIAKWPEDKWHAEI